MKNSETLQDLRKVLSRLFMGRVSVKGGSFETLRRAAVIGAFRRVLVYSLPKRNENDFVRASVLSEAPVCGTSEMLSLEREGCPVFSGFRELSRAHLFSLPCAFSVIPRGELLHRKKVRVVAALDIIITLPQKRKNLMGFLQARFPGAFRAGIFAFFSPLVRSCVRKTALDKNAGTLDVWMEPRKAGMRPYHLLLRKIPGEAGLKWVWMEAGKNDNIFGGGVE